MRTPLGLALVLVLALTGCDAGKQAGSTPNTMQYDSASKSPGQTTGDTEARAKAETTTTDSLVATRKEDAEFEQVSLNTADAAAAAAEAADRKIIRNANLTLEVNSTTEAQQKVTSIAESHGGFVVTSESKQRQAAEPERRTLDIKLVLRIPAARFGAALDQIRGLANNLSEENITGQDVTEEFIDLEARIRTQKALELQFLEIMKQARKVEDALEVQRQIADVRTDIEKLEGRKRFLQDRASLSTITVNLEAPKQIVVNATGFGRSVREAVSDGVDFGSALLLFLVRFVIIMVPLTLFVLLPMGLLFRYFVRRAKRIRLAEVLSTASD